MEDTPVASRSARRMALLGSALFGYAVWVIFPLLRRQGFDGVAEVTLGALAPIALCVGLATRSYGALLVGVPVGWLSILPFAPRDQLGEIEVVLMAISLLAYVLCVLSYGHRQRNGVATQSIVWVSDSSAPQGRFGLVGIVVFAAVFLSGMAVLWLPYDSDLWIVYTPGAVSRFKVGMILCLTLLGLGCLKRAKHIRQRFFVRYHTATFLGVALSACSLVVIRRWM